MMTGNEKPAMTEQQREAFEATNPTPTWMTFNSELNQYVAHDHVDSRKGVNNRNRDWATWQVAWQAALSHAEGEAVDLEIGAGDVLICDLGTASAAGVAFYRDNAAHDVGTYRPELSGMGGTELAGRIFSVMTEKPESLIVLYNAVGRALATLGHPAPHAEGEAFGWFTEDHDTDKSATTYDPVVADRWRKKGWPVWPLYTHPAPHAEGEAVDHWAVRNPGLADQFRAEAQTVRKRLGFEPDADDVSPNDLRERIDKIEGAPQVAVPEGWKLVPKRATKEMAEAAAERRGCKVSANLYAAINEATAAAPTAPAGEPDDSDICEQVELPHVLAWADGIRGDMWTEYADRITDEEARVAQAVWAAHTGEQPVSDPDGLPEPLCYLNPKVIDGDTGKLKRGLGAITYSTDKPADSWNVPGYLSAPDEREIAAKALDGFADLLEQRAKEYARINPTAVSMIKKDAILCRQQARLRAGKEGE